MDLSKFRKYHTGDKLKDNEYLLKVRDSVSSDRTSTGFYAKLNKDGSLQKSFADWGRSRYYQSNEAPLEIYIVEETFKSGWRLSSWRFGQSQNWASLIHPEGFTLEIYLTDFLDVVQNNTIVNGEIQGSFKWEKNKLIAEPRVHIDHILQLIPGALS